MDSSEDFTVDLHTCWELWVEFKPEITIIPAYSHIPGKNIVQFGRGQSCSSLRSQLLYWTHLIP